MLFSHEKEVLPFGTTWMNLEGIMQSEISQTEIKTVWPHFCVESKTELMETVDWWLPRPEGWGRWGDVGQKAQTSSYKMNKCWGSKVQFGDYR